MAKGSTDLLAKVGSWAFIIGVIIALIVGIFSDIEKSAIAAAVLVLLGLIVGFLNVTGRETTPFLLATISLVIVSDFGSRAFSAIEPELVGAAMSGTLTALLFFVIPATIIVALKAIYALAHDE